MTFNIEKYECAGKMKWCPPMCERIIPIIYDEGLSLHDKLGQIICLINRISDNLCVLKKWLENELPNLIVQILDEEVKKQMEIVRKELMEYIEELNQQIMTRLDDVEAMVSTLENNVNMLNNKVQELDADVNDINQNIDTILDTINTINDNVGELRKDVTDLQTSMENVTTTVTNLEQNMNTLTQTVTNIETNVTNLTQTVNNIDTDVTNLTVAVTNVENNLSSLAQTVNGLAGDIKKVSDDLEEVDNTVDDHENRIKALEDAGESPATDPRVDTLISDVSGLKTNVNNLSTEVTDINGDVAAVEADIADLKNIKAYIDTVLCSISSIETNNKFYPQKTFTMTNINDALGTNFRTKSEIQRGVFLNICLVYRNPTDGDLTLGSMQIPLELASSGITMCVPISYFNGAGYVGGAVFDINVNYTGITITGTKSFIMQVNVNTPYRNVVSTAGDEVGVWPVIVSGLGYITTSALRVTVTITKK